MRKRLRKKRHLGEFREWGLPIAIQRTHPDGSDGFLDGFIAQAIAAHGLAFRGGGHGDRLAGVIEVGRTADPTEARLQHVRHLHSFPTRRSSDYRKSVV